MTMVAGLPKSVRESCRVDRIILYPIKRVSVKCQMPCAHVRNPLRLPGADLFFKLRFFAWSSMILAKAARIEGVEMGHSSERKPITRTRWRLSIGLWLLALLGLPIPTLANVAPPHSTTPPAAAKQIGFQYFLPNTNSSTSTSSPKKGLAWTYQYCEDAAAVNAHWVYDWGMNPKICDTNLESIPMVRDAEQWARTHQVGGNSEWILGFNEPDLCPDQACLTPEQAVPLWREIELAYPDRKLVAPVPSQLNLNWLVEFRARYLALYQTPPRFDALAAHVYTNTFAPAVAVIDWYRARAREYGVSEIWVTEFSFLVAESGTCYGVPHAAAMRDAQQFITLLEYDPLVTRYGWFAPRIDIHDLVIGHPLADCNAPLLNFSGTTLTAWGMMYRAR